MPPPDNYPSLTDLAKTTIPPMQPNAHGIFVHPVHFVCPDCEPRLEVLIAHHGPHYYASLVHYDARGSASGAFPTTSHRRFLTPAKAAQFALEYGATHFATHARCIRSLLILRGNTDLQLQIDFTNNSPI